MVLNRPPTSAHSAQFGEGFSLPGLPFRVSARRGLHAAGRLLLAQPAHQGHRAASGGRSNPAPRPHRGLLAAPKQAISCVCRGPAESAVARTSAPDPRRHRAPRGPTNTLGRRAHATPVRLAPHAPRRRRRDARSAAASPRRRRDRAGPGGGPARAGGADGRRERSPPDPARLGQHMAAALHGCGTPGW